MRGRQEGKAGNTVIQGRTFFLPMNFLEKTLRDWKVMLLPMAARKPAQLKVASVADARATPPTTGSSDSTMGMLGDSPRNSALSSTLKKGSMACVNAKYGACIGWSFVTDQ